jgi:hypothetical protein
MNKAGRGMAVAGQEIGVSAFERAEEQPVFDRPAVDEEILRQRIGAVVGRHRRVSGEMHAFAFRFDFGCVVGEIAAHQTREPRERALEQRILGGEREHHAAFIGQGEADIGTGHGEPLYGVDDGERFGAGRFEKFEPRRRGVEKVAHLDARTGLAGGKKAGRLGAGKRACIDRDGMRVRGFGCGSKC